MGDKVMLIYDNDVLVGAKKIVEDEEPSKLSSLLKATSATHKQHRWRFNELTTEIARMEKYLRSLERLLEIRTAERDGAKNAHKQRLLQVKHLKDQNYELRGRIMVLEEEMFEMDNDDDDELGDIVISMKVDANKRPHAVAAKAVKKKEK